MQCWEIWCWRGPKEFEGKIFARGTGGGGEILLREMGATQGGNHSHLWYRSPCEVYEIHYWQE